MAIGPGLDLEAIKADCAAVQSASDQDGAKQALAEAIYNAILSAKVVTDTGMPDAEHEGHLE